jgi:hypothetical protein
MELPYQYNQLPHADSIRLLHLIHNDDDERLLCTLMEVSLSDLGDFGYLAMSYTWGASSDKVAIHCDDRDHIIMIPRNLYAGLHCFAKERWTSAIDTGDPIGYNEDVWIWADACCIWQSNNDEKNQQIPLMRRIYQSAAVVFIWLGEEEDGDQGLVALLSDMHRNVTQAVADQDPTKVDLLALRNSRQIPPAASPDWTRLGNLYREPWFTRKWVIQEVACAKLTLIMKGPRILPAGPLWELPELLINTDLISLVKDAMEDRITGILNGMRQAGAMYVQRQNLLRGVSPSLLELLCQFRDSQAAVKVDHIIALVGIASDGGHPAYQPDVTREVTELYRSFAWTTINQYSSLRVLSVAGLQDGLPGLPSWTPDWTVSPQVLAYGMAFPEAFRASGRTRDLGIFGWLCWVTNLMGNHLYAMLRTHLLHPSSQTADTTQGCVCLSDDSTVLTVLGKCVDTIKDVGIAQTPQNIASGLDEPQIIPDWVRAVWTPKEIQRRYAQVKFGEHSRAEAERLIQQLPFYPNYVGGGTMEDAFWRTLIWNTTFKGEQIPNSYRQNYLSMLEMVRVLQSPENTFDASMEEHFHRTHLFEQIYHNASTNRRFYTTHKGFIGQAPSTAVTGDIVCILKGANVPFILRKAGDKYVLIGECYCHGIMYGEAMQWSDLRLQEISII